MYIIIYYIIYFIIRVATPCLSIVMANMAVLARHTISRSKSLVEQPEVSCRKPEVKDMVDVCDGAGLFHGTLMADGLVSATSSSRPPLTHCLSETGTGNCRTGSCFPASSSKHFRSSSIVAPITPDELASLVGAGNGSDVSAGRPIAVVDCRTFLAFNTNHVAGAFNASCGDRFSRKRLTQGRATVADLISGGPSTDGVGGAREAYRRLAENVSSSSSGLFVAYDDNTTKLEALQESHPLRLLTTSLIGSGCRTRFLEGACIHITLQGLHYRVSWWYSG